MKHRIARLSPHQNGKVMGAFMGVISLVFLVPLFLFALPFTPPDQRPPLFVVFAAPVFYLVFTYVFVAIGCFIYNLLVRFVGGLEFESAEHTSPLG